MSGMSLSPPGSQSLTAVQGQLLVPMTGGLPKHKLSSANKSSTAGHMSTIGVGVLEKELH